MYRLGKKPARKGAIKFDLKKYFDFSAYPPPPASFGNYDVVPYRMYANDRLGDCVFAGAANETVDWNLDSGRVVTFRDEDVVAAYSEVTGYDLRDPSTDQGTDVQMAASWRRKVGLMDASGVRHPVYAYATLRLDDMAAIKAATYYFGGAGVGIRVYDYMFDEFDAHQPWSAKRGGNMEGGHYVPALGWRGESIVVATWARWQLLTVDFAREIMDEIVFYLDPTRMAYTLSPEGIDIVRLETDILRANREDLNDTAS